MGNKKNSHIFVKPLNSSHHSESKIYEIFRSKQSTPCKPVQCSYMFNAAIFYHYVYLYFVGRSHSRDYTMFREGTPASESVRMFAKTGRSDKLDDGGGEGLNGGSGGGAVEDKVLNTFVAPSVSTGAAWTQSQFFVDGNHSRVSID